MGGSEDPGHTAPPGGHGQQFLPRDNTWRETALLISDKLLAPNRKHLKRTTFGEIIHIHHH